MKPQTFPLSTNNINLQALKAEQISLNNGISVHLLKHCAQPIIRLDFIFEAGTYYQSIPFQAAAACGMLSESTQKHTAKYIAEKLDFFGAHLEKEIGRDFVSISLYCVYKQFGKILPLVEQIIKQPAYKQKEFKKYIENEQQRHIHAMQKVQNIARSRFQSLIFGNQHPYGTVLKTEDFLNLQNSDLFDFHQSYYTSDNCRILLSGYVDETTIKILNDYFGGNDWHAKVNMKNAKYVFAKTQPCEEIIPKEKALQSAICVGKAIINSNHEDFANLSIVNTLLGGYFGSRLMKNIREEKAYTYGIGSGLVSYKHQGFFCISTQTAVETAGLCMEEIYKELKFLRTNPVSKKELELVQNYLIGEFMREIDGILDIAERVKLLIQMGFSVNFYKNYLQAINHITQEDVLRLSEEYLHEDSMVKVMAGANQIEG